MRAGIIEDMIPFSIPDGYLWADIIEDYFDSKNPFKGVDVEFVPSPDYVTIYIDYFFYSREEAYTLAQSYRSAIITLVENEDELISFLRY